MKNPTNSPDIGPITEIPSCLATLQPIIHPAIKNRKLVNAEQALLCGAVAVPFGIDIARMLNPLLAPVSSHATYTTILNPKSHSSIFPPTPALKINSNLFCGQAVFMTPSGS